MLCDDWFSLANEGNRNSCECSKVLLIFISCHTRTAFFFYSHNYPWSIHKGYDLLLKTSSTPEDITNNRLEKTSSTRYYLTAVLKCSGVLTPFTWSDLQFPPKRTDIAVAARSELNAPKRFRINYGNSFCDRVILLASSLKIPRGAAVFCQGWQWYYRHSIDSCNRPFFTIFVIQWFNS